jgi:voltage-gated potassium channel
MKPRKRTWEIVEAAGVGDAASRIFDVGIIVLVFLNVAAVIVGTVPSVSARWGRPLRVFEIVSVIVFTLEYAARLWSCTVDERFKHPVLGRVRCALQPMLIIDLLAVLPFYFPFMGVDLRGLRALRLLRILRIAKVGRYYSSLDLIKQVVRAKKEELVLTFALLMLLLVMSSSVLYYCENSAQPETFSSIPATMWWAVATLTTVGYGDIYPVTVMGKVCASAIAILGIGVFALPTGILGAGFVEAIQERKIQPQPGTCPLCGRSTPPTGDTSHE